jgi:hypothetical protein
MFSNGWYCHIYKAILVYKMLFGVEKVGNGKKFYMEMVGKIYNSVESDSFSK